MPLRRSNKCGAFFCLSRGSRGNGEGREGILARFVLEQPIRSSMWCPNCKEDFPDVVGAEVQICPKCIAASRAGRRRYRVPKLRTTRKKLNASPSKHSQPKLRIDPAHVVPREKLPTFVPDPLVANQIARNLQLGKRSLKHAIAFGLLVFLVGQSILIWAFLAGHFAAWSVGNLVTIMGVAISLISVSQTLGVIEKRIDELGSAVWQARNERKKVSRKAKRTSTDRIEP